MVKWIAGARFDIKMMVIALKTFEKVNIFLTFCYMFSQTADLNSKLSRDFANCRFRKLQISQITDFANYRFCKVQISFHFVNYSKPDLWNTRPKGRRFDSHHGKGSRFDYHRGWAYFSRSPGVDIHSE